MRRETMDTKTDTNPPILCVRCGGAGANVYGGGVWSHYSWSDCIEHLTARVEAAEAERDAAWQRVAKLEVITRPDSGLADLAGLPEADMAESLGVSGLTGRPVLECAMWWRREAYDARETMRAEIDIAAAAEARVAELETQLAEQQWRPGSETPPPDWYQTVETIDGVFSHAYFDGAVWQGYPDNYPPLWYRPIPPLPQEPTP